MSGSEERANAVSDPDRNRPWETTLAKPERKVRFSPRKASLAGKLMFHSAPTNDGCIVWTGSKDKDGYGKFMHGYRHWRAHVAAWFAAYGPIPAGKQVCHTCDNPPCIRLEHLWIGTTQENTADRDAKKRQQHGERHYKAKLTEDQVREIRKDTRSQIRIAADYGIVQTMVSKIKRREFWKHVI